MASFHPMHWAERALSEADMAQAWQQVLRELSDFGIADATFVFGQPTNAQAVPTHAHKFGVFLDDEWDRRIHSEPQLAMGDPIARRFFARERPLHVQRGNALYRSMSAKEQAFYRNFEEHDVRAGAVWPVHDRRAGVVHVIASWTKSSEREYVEALERFSAEIHVATTWFCEALRMRELAELTPSLSLSPRERECLLWVQTGQSTKQIGDRLMLSDATVNEYVGGATRKLDASNRVQAAARAAILGLIQP